MLGFFSFALGPGVRTPRRLNSGVVSYTFITCLLPLPSRFLFSRVCLSVSEAVDDPTSGQLGVQIDSPAREGEANESLCEYLSEVCKKHTRLHRSPSVGIHTPPYSRYRDSDSQRRRRRRSEASSCPYLLLSPKLHYRCVYTYRDIDLYACLYGVHVSTGTLSSLQAVLGVRP